MSRNVSQSRKPICVLNDPNDRRHTDKATASEIQAILPSDSLVDLGSKKAKLEGQCIKPGWEASGDAAAKERKEVAKMKDWKEQQQAAMRQEPLLRPDRCKCGNRIRNSKCTRCGTSNPKPHKFR